MKKNKLAVLVLASMMSLSLSLLSYAEEGQSARWAGSGDRWQVSDNNGGFIKNCWFQDDVTNHWYVLGAEDGSVMYSGLITDESTGKSYLLNTNHDGTFGKMLTVDWTYNINGKDVSITFNQAHDGSFGAITSGLEEVRNTGVNEKKLDKIPTDEAKPATPSPRATQNKSTSPQVSTGSGNNRQVGDMVREQLVNALKNPKLLSKDDLRFDKNGNGIIDGEEIDVYILYNGDASAYERDNQN